ncbi:hypothetical protein BGX28_001293 [Mortierella sp. GBA30]|nr:hypothetical protein BGX28_001293 [Mortierella sp. GBA30]
MITSTDLSTYASLVDEGQQELELSVSYYTSDGLAPTLSASPLVPTSDTFLVLIRFLDGSGAYMTISDAVGSTIELDPGDAERLLYYAFDIVTLDTVRVPPGARAVVIQVVVPTTRTSFCFDYFALRISQGSYYPTTESLLQKALVGLGAIVLANAIIVPVILFHGLPGWFWRSAPVNFFQKNPVVDHYVPLALFISTCQWIYNILLQYLGGTSSKISIVHSPQALWLIPLVLIGTFFVTAFAHWALFLCYNHVMQQQSRSPRRLFFHTKPRRWRAPLLGLWSTLCLMVARVGVVAIAVVQGGYWSVTIGILLAVPETLAMFSVLVFFLKTMWILIRTRKDLQNGLKDRGICSKGIAEGVIPSSTHRNYNKVPSWMDGLRKITTSTKNRGADLSRSSSTTPLRESNRRSMSSDSGSPIFDDPQDDLIDLSSVHHRAYVKSLLVPELDLKEAAGSMYGRSTIGSDKATLLQFQKPTSLMKGIHLTTNTNNSSNHSDTNPYMGSTLNTTVSLASSSGTEYTRYPTEFDFNIRPSQMQQQQQKMDGRLLSPSSAAYDRNRNQFPFEISLQQQGHSSRPGTRTGAGVQTGAGASEKSASTAGGVRQGRPGMHRNQPSNASRDGLHGLNSNATSKLTWNSATTSYTTASAAQPMTGAPPTPSAWEYVVYPQLHVWPTIKGTYLLIARLPLRILVAVSTTLVLCYDVLLSIGAAETVLAVPVSCLLGAMAYPGQGQFDNTMNVARAMHTVNLVLVVVLLPAVVMMTVLHQIRMVQKYNWCLRLLRIGNYGFVPGGREYTQHLKHPVRFIGYTVGFGVVGLCFTIFVLFTLSILVAMLLVAATFRSSIFRTLGSRALAAFGISCLLVLILWIVQMLVIRYRFRMPGSRFLLAPQQSARASFHHWEFFWAFFNIVFGAFAFCKRIVLSILSMGIYSTRVDLCIMGGRFRPWDGGYSAFVGLVLADHVLNNPIVLEFVQILRDLLVQRRFPPHLAHFYLEARGRASSSSPSSRQGNSTKTEDDELREQRERRLMLLMRPTKRALNDIEEGEEVRMDELLMASSSSNGNSSGVAGVGVGGGGVAIKGGAIVPEVSRIHHYFRQDPRVDRHGTGQGPLSTSPGTSDGSNKPGSSSPPPAYSNNKNNNRMSKIYTPLLTTTTATGTTTIKDPLTMVASPTRHVHLQDPILHNPATAVSQEQIRQKLTEAKRRSIRVRNRWFLYVTLVRNPQLCLLRRTTTKDFLHPIAHGEEYLGSHQEEALTDIQWDRED